MPRRTYDDGYQDGYDDAEAELGRSSSDDDLYASITLRDVEDVVEETLRKLRMGYTLDLTLREFLEDLERRLIT